MTIPVLDAEGKRSYQKINTQDQDSVDINYDENDLKVRVETAPSFGSQQDESLRQTAMLCQAMPGFADFFHKKGLKFIIKNLHIKGSEELAELVEKYEQELQQQMQQQQQMAQMQMQMNPTLLKVKHDQSRLELDIKKHEDATAVEAGKLALGEEELELKRMQLLAEMQQFKDEMLISINRHIDKETRSAVDTAIKHLQHEHTIKKDINAAHHDVMREILAHNKRSVSLDSNRSPLSETSAERSEPK